MSRAATVDLSRQLDVSYFRYDDFSSGYLEERQHWLSAPEVLRADAFMFSRDRRAYLTTHLALRAVLARYVDLPPEQLEIGPNPRGRPELREVRDAPWFSISHCVSAGVVLVGRERAIGIDIEALSRSVPVDLAQAYFSPDEVQLIARTDEPLRHRIFLELWTLKEAFAKAKELGLALPLEHSTFIVGPGGRIDAAFREAVRERSSDWDFRTFTIPGHQCGLAARRSPGAAQETSVSIRRLSASDGVGFGTQ